ncbi:MAG TPA: hypothetical protein VH590_08530 [Ktedonobacterales bacterium]
MARYSPSSAPPDKSASSLVVRPFGWSSHLPRRARAILVAARLPALWVAVLAEIALLLVALVPQSIWAGYGYPTGPIPNTLAPLVAAAFYLLPTLTGALCRRWYAAVMLAALPALLDLGVFAIAAARRVGPFYLAQDPHSVNTVSTLELFVVLGALGWLLRRCLLDLPAARGADGP